MFCRNSAKIARKTGSRRLYCRCETQRSRCAECQSTQFASVATCLGGHVAKSGITVRVSGHGQQLFVDVVTAVPFPILRQKQSYKRTGTSRYVPHVAAKSLDETCQHSTCVLSTKHVRGRPKSADRGQRRSLGRWRNRGNLPGRKTVVSVLAPDNNRCVSSRN